MTDSERVRGRGRGGCGGADAGLAVAVQMRGASSNFIVKRWLQSRRTKLLSLLLSLPVLSAMMRCAW